MPSWKGHHCSFIARDMALAIPCDELAVTVERDIYGVATGWCRNHLPDVHDNRFGRLLNKPKSRVA